MNNKKRGAFLRKAREAKNLTQEELGNLIFYSDKTISAWEKGIYTPSDYETIIKLSEVLDISPLAILYGEENTTEEEQLFSYLNYQKSNRLKLIVLSIIFLFTLITILVAFYYTNLRDTSRIYSLTSGREDVIIDNSFYYHNKSSSILYLSKVSLVNNKYYIKRIDLYYLENGKRIKIFSGPNDVYFIENNNMVNEYNIKDLLKKSVYLSIYTNKNQEIKTPILIDKTRKTISKEEKPNKENISRKNKLKELGFIYQDGEYIYQKDNITIRYTDFAVLNLVKENKDNNEYLYKRINDKNMIYRKIYNDGKYKVKDLLIEEKSTCNISKEKDMESLIKCLNYLSDVLK